MTAQEERVGDLLKMANKLVEAGHYSSDIIQDRREKVVQAKDRLEANDVKKRGELDESKLFKSSGEMNSFVSEKRKLVREGSYGIGILRQRQRSSP